MSVTLQAIRNHFFEVCHWVDPEHTCDVVYTGDPDRPVQKVGTGWSCCSQNLEAAKADGCDLFISHEDLLHGEYWAPNMHSKETPWGCRRRIALESSGMACMRLHDTWDNFPECGIRDSWRSFLGLGELLAERPYHYSGKNKLAAGNSLALCRIPLQSFREFAVSVAERCKVFPCFQGATCQGNLDKKLNTVATGVGCHIPTLEMLELGADVLVLTFDRALQETIRVPLMEMNACLIVVEHGVSEMPGMRRMATHLQETFPGIEAVFYCKEPAAMTIF